MLKTEHCLYAFLCFLFTTYSHTCPPYPYYDSSKFTNLECTTVSVDTIPGKNKMILNPSAPIPDRHQIISAVDNPGTDPYGGFPILSPYAGNFSVKLGNNITDAEAEAISYTFMVPTDIDTFTFTYFYAVVFEDPEHLAHEQPRFFVTAYDVGTGKLINCASYDYISTSA